jgi:FAD/FMN-containing dehydrogenase
MFQKVTSLLGPHKVFHPQSIDPTWLQDQRGRFTSLPLAVVFPDSHEDVVRLVRFCSAENLSLVAQAGNTGLVGGAVANGAQQILLNFSRMNRIRALYPQDRVMVAEAGCTLLQVNDAAKAHGLRFPLGLSVADRCCVGGNIATNAGGMNVLRHGMTRNLIYGIEGVLADGTPLHHLVRVPKNNVGFDVAQLFIGTEGTLALMTAATLKLVTLPQTTASVMVACDDLACAVSLLHRLQEQTADHVESFEIMSRDAMDLVVHHRNFSWPLKARTPWIVLTQIIFPHFCTPQEALPAIIGDLKAEHAVVAITADEQTALWYPRQTLPWIQGPSIKHDVAVPLSELPAFLASTQTLLMQIVPGIRPIIFGHLGDGNVHYNLLPPLDCPPEVFLARAPQLQDLIYEQVLRHHGSISAEHGLGRVKKNLYHQYADPGTLSVVHRIKQSLDPHHRLNPEL